MRNSVSDSSPFVALTITASGSTYGAAARTTARHPWEGSAETTMADPRSASLSSPATLTVAGIVTSGR